RASDRCPLQACATHVARTAEVVRRVRRAEGPVRLEIDEVANLVAIDRDGGSAPAALPGEPGLDTSTVLGLHRRNAVSRIVEIVERGRPKSGPRQGPDLQPRDDFEGVAGAASRVAAVNGVVVLSNVRLQAVLAELTRVAQDTRMVVPAERSCERIAS